MKTEAIGLHNIMVQMIKISESFVKVHCEDFGILRSISDYLTFDDPAAPFKKAFKMGFWDGKVRLMDKQGVLSFGLWSYVRQFCEENDYEYEIDPEITTKCGTEKCTDEWLDSLNIHNNDGEPIKHYEHQRKLIQKAIEEEKILMQSPTSSGKTLIFYSLVRWYFERVQGKILVIVPSVLLVNQAEKDFLAYSKQGTLWDVKANLHRIFAGLEKDTSKRVVVSTWQSLVDKPAEFFEDFDVILGDEAHLYTAANLTTILGHLSNAKYRIGATGTVKKGKINELSLQGLFGRIYKEVTTRELMDKGIVADLMIKAFMLKYPEEECKAMHKTSYDEEIKFVINHKLRMDFLIRVLSNLKGNTLVLFELIEHGALIMEALSRIAGKRVFYIDGKVKEKDRTRILQEMEIGDDAILVATFGTCAVGMSVRNIKHLVLGSPGGKSEVRVLQSLGRSLRKSGRKDRATAIDIVDVLTYKRKQNFLFKHFLERWAFYDQEKLDNKIFNIDLVSVKKTELFA